ncbi:hypothetical protein DYI26_22120 [Halomonas litopenaei]|nr:hypothetical protein [Halomonas litopenaei]
MRKRSLRGVNEHFDPIFNAVLPSAGTFQTSPSSPACGNRALNQQQPVAPPPLLLLPLFDKGPPHEHFPGRHPLDPHVSPRPPR